MNLTSPKLEINDQKAEIPVCVQQEQWDTVNNLTSPKPEINANRLESFTSSKPNEIAFFLSDLPPVSFDVYTVPSDGVVRLLPEMDFKLDSEELFLYSVMTKVGHYPKAARDYQILLTSYNLRELYDSYLNAYRAHLRIRTVVALEKVHLAVQKLAASLCHKFFTIFSYKLKWNPCGLFKLFHSEQNLSLLLTFAFESFNSQYAKKTIVLNAFIVLDKYLDKSDNENSFDSKFRVAYSALSFLKPFIDKYYLPDLSTDEADEWRNLETYKSLFPAMEKIYLKMVSFTKNRPIGRDFTPKSKTFYDDMHCFFKFWKSSLDIPIKRSDFSFKSKANFVNLKDRFLISLRRNDANAKTFLVPLIYWCLNFTHPRNFDIRFFSSLSDPNLSDPRDIILIILCSRSTCSLESRFAFAKKLYSNHTRWFLSAKSFEFFEYVRFFFFDRIPSNLFRKSDSDWDDWHKHFKTVIDNLAFFNSHAFESLSRQVLCLNVREVVIHETTLLFKQRIKDAANKICLPIASEGDLAPVFTIFEELLEKNTQVQNDYSADLALSGDNWLFDLLNGLGRYISACLDSNLSEELSYDTAKRVICSLANKEMSELRASVTISRKKKGIFKFFSTFDSLIKTVEKQDLGENTLLNCVTERVNYKFPSFSQWPNYNIYTDWSYDIKCKKIDSVDLLKIFDLQKKSEFIEVATKYFEGNEDANSLAKKLPLKLAEVAEPIESLVIEFGTEEVLFNTKSDFWSGLESYTVKFLRLFRSLSYFNLLHSWVSFLEEILSLLKCQEAIELKYPRLKINLFNGVTMSAKVIEDENMQSVVSTMNNLFRLLEHFVDLKFNREQVEELSRERIRELRKEMIGEFLQKAMFIPFLFRPTEFTDPTRVGTFIETIDWYDIFFRTRYSNNYRGHYDKYCEGIYELYYQFKDGYQPKTPKTFDSELIHLFELIRKLIYRREIPLDPAQFMAFGRKMTGKYLSRDLGPPRRGLGRWNRFDYLYRSLNSIIESLLKAPNDISEDELIIMASKFKNNLLEIARKPNFSVIFRNMRFPVFSGYILKRLAREGFTTEKYHLLANFSKLFLRLDEAFFIGRKIEPIIDQFVKNELPGLLEK